MNLLQSPRSSRIPYAGFADGRTNCHPPGIRHRNSRDSSTFTEDDFNGTMFRHPQRTWSDRQLFFDEIVGKLSQALHESEQVLRRLQAEFDEEIGPIKWYAPQAMIDSLWEMRLDLKKLRRDTKLEDGSLGDPRLDEKVSTTKAAKQARLNLEKALQASIHRTRAAVTPKRRNLKLAQDKAGIERTVTKLQTSGSQCLDLLTLSKKRYAQFEPLLKELEFLQKILEDWKEFEIGPEDCTSEGSDERFENYGYN